LASSPLSKSQQGTVAASFRLTPARPDVLLIRCVTPLRSQVATATAPQRET
jgi:hypothetical protein